MVTYSPSDASWRQIASPSGEAPSVTRARIIRPDIYGAAAFQQRRVRTDLAPGGGPE